MAAERKPVRSHRDLVVYQRAKQVADVVFLLSKKFPKGEMFSLTDQVRRSSRSVTANIAEAWRKRRYEAAFVAKLNDAEAEAAETEVWIEHAVTSKYLSRADAVPPYKMCEEVLRMLVSMCNNPGPWILRPDKPK